MSFHSLSRSNNRHNFIGQDMGDIGSASPFAQATARDGSGGFKKKESESTIIRIDDVDKDTRNALAKDELRKKLSGRARSSVEFQKIEKWHNHKEMNKELLPEIMPRVMPPLMEEQALKHNRVADANQETRDETTGRSKSDGITLVAANMSSAVINTKNGEGNSRFGAHGGRNDEESDDDDYGEDVYGWRFDKTKEGEEENERNLEFHGTPKLNDEGTANIRNRDVTQGSFNSNLQSARNMISNLNIGFPVTLNNSFVNEQRQEKIGDALKSVASATSASLKAIGSVVSKVTDATGKILHDMDDPKHILGEKTDSYMKIHDLNSAPTKDTAKKKRVKDINRVIEQARMFGVNEDGIDSVNGKSVTGENMRLPDNNSKDENGSGGFTRGLEGIITNVTMSKSRILNPNKEQGSAWEKKINKDELFGSKHEMKFVDDGFSRISTQEYKTLFDVKDVHGYQEEYFGKYGPGMRTMTAPEAKEVLSHKIGLHTTRRVGQNNVGMNDLDKASVDETGSRHSLDDTMVTIKDTPAGKFIMDPLTPLIRGQQPPKGNLSPKENHGILVGKGIHASRDTSSKSSMVSPGHGYHTTHAGLSKKNSMSRSFNKMSRKLEPVDLVDSKYEAEAQSRDTRENQDSSKISSGSRMNLLQASASFLTKEMKRASSWILPPRDEEKVQLHTKKNPVPPAATQSMGFSREDNATMDCHDKNEKAPFSLLSPLDRATSFASNFRGGGGNKNKPRQLVSPINNMRRVKTSNSLLASNIEGQHRDDTLPLVSVPTDDNMSHRDHYNEESNSSATRPHGRVKSSSGLLSDRHYTTIREASVGHSKPVIYNPSSRSSAASLASDGPIHRTKEGETVSWYSNKSLNESSNFSERVVDSRGLHGMTEGRSREKNDGVGDGELVSSTRIAAASQVGPDLVEVDLNKDWKACWDAEAGSVYYYNTATGEASWLPPTEVTIQQDDPKPKREALSQSDEVDNSDDENDRDLFLRALNNGLPRGLSELQMGESDLTIKTRTIAARHSLYSKLRTRYEGDKETEYTASLIAREHKEYGEKEHQEIMYELNKEVDSWIEDE